MSLAEEYDQQSFIARVTGQTSVRSRAGDLQTVLSNDEETESKWKQLTRERGRVPGEDLKENGSSQTSSYVVTGIGVPHEIEFFLPQPNGNFGRMLFEAIGIRYRV